MLVFTVGTFLLRFIFSSVYFKQIGLCPSYSGIILGASRLAHGFGGLSLGYIADKADIRNSILALAYLAYSITPFLLTLPKPVNNCDGKSIKSKRNFNRFSFIEIQKVNKTRTNPSRLLDIQTMQYSTDKVQKRLPFLRDTFRDMKPHYASSNRTSNGMAARSSKHTTKSMLRRDIENDSRLVPQHNTIVQSLDMETLKVNYESVISKRRSISNFTDESGRQFSGVNSSNVATTKLPATNNERTLFYLLLGIIIIGDFLGGATINFFDTLAVSTVDDKKDYGKIRMWGNIGQAVTIPVTAIITYFKEIEICGVLQSDYKVSLYITSVISGVGWFVAVLKVRMPSSKLHADDDNDNEEDEATSVAQLIAPIGTWSILIMVVFFGIFSSSLSGFLFWTMVDLNPSQANFSIAVANFCRNLAALFIYFFAPTILHGIGYRNALSFSCLGFAAAYVTASLMFNPWIGVIVETLASIAYAMSQAACISYFGEVAHHSIAITAQGMCDSLFVYTNMYR